VLGFSFLNSSSEIPAVTGGPKSMDINLCLADAAPGCLSTLVGSTVITRSGRKKHILKLSSRCHQLNSGIKILSLVTLIAADGPILKVIYWTLWAIRSYWRYASLRYVKWRFLVVCWLWFWKFVHCIFLTMMALDGILSTERVTFLMKWFLCLR